MGCISSNSSASCGVGLDGSSTKAWLKLEEQAASVQAYPRKDGAEGLVVVVAGMDRYGLVGVLEHAFRCRGFGIASGEWEVKGFLFHGTFNLYPLPPINESTPLSVTSESETNGIADGTVRNLHTQRCVGPHSPQAAYVPAATNIVTRLKVDVEHTMGEELHVGFLSVVNDCGGHTYQGVLRRGAESEMHDSFWINCVNIDKLISECFVSPDVLQSRLRAVRAALEEANDKPSSIPDLMVPSRISQGSTSTDSLLDALRQADRRALQKLVLELPVAVMDRVSKTPYEIKPSSWGYQLEGFQKYMGAGVIINEDGVGASDAAPVLQFTTLYVQSHNTVYTGSAKFRRSLATLKARQYGEFVNSIDVNRRCFTVERVFLNSVCPARHNIGASTAAEQLFAPVWERGSAGLGELLPIHKMREIKLRDVVNWNTYAVMASAVHMRGECCDKFGEHFESALNQEIRIANLTRQKCSSLPLVDVLLHTQLGKMIGRMIKFWHEESSVRLKCKNAKVIFSTEKEIIAGEVRDVMDILVEVEVEYAATLKPNAWKLGEEESSAREEEPIDTETSVKPLSAGEAAVKEWVKTIKDSCGEMDHGFSLGSADVHETESDHTHITERTALKAIKDAIHAIQDERGWSCLAVADGLLDGTADGLAERRKVTDKALVIALEMTTSEAVRAVSNILILHRTVIDQNVASDKNWELRYRIVCAEARAFNQLIGNLVEWLIGACKKHPEIAVGAESITLFCYFREQLGRERAFVLARGRTNLGRILEGDKDAMRNLACMSATRNLIGDLLQINSGFAAVFRKLDAAESQLVLDDELDPQDWYEVITLCMDMVGKLIDDLIGSGEDGERSAERDRI